MHTCKLDVELNKSDLKSWSIEMMCASKFSVETDMFQEQFSRALLLLVYNNLIITIMKIGKWQNISIFQNNEVKNLFL